MERLQEIGPAYGYLPEPSKSILVVRAHKLELTRSEFKDLGFQVTTGSRYLGGYVGSSSEQELWVQEKMSIWTSVVTDLAFTALSQAAKIAAAWMAVCPESHLDGIGDSFSPLEKAISNIFLPALFGDSLVSKNHRELAELPVKCAGLALPDPTCSHLLEAFRGVVPFNSVDHKAVRASVTSELKSLKTVKDEMTLTSIITLLDCDTRRTIRWGTETGPWLSVMPFMLNGTKLSAQEFWDALLLRYARSPEDLPSQCDGCGAAFSVRHALKC
jgi:hypothetical protein